MLQLVVVEEECVYQDVGESIHILQLVMLQVKLNNFCHMSEAVHVLQLVLPQY